MTFESLQLVEPILRAITAKGYHTPTPIQEQAIPVGLEGRDLLGIAQTGTGKTAAFAIPIIQQLLTSQQRKASIKRPIKALIITPTRELAIQIDDCFAEYAQFTSLRHAVIFGGVSQRPQEVQLAKGVDILTATPGRLLDLMAQGIIKLTQVTHFVLDEADRMLDMGFVHDIKRILPLLPNDKQTLFFSATMPDSISTLAKRILKQPIKVEVTPESSVVETIDQWLYYVEKPLKGQLLAKILQDENEKTALIFSRTKHGADKIARVLTKQGLPCDAIHGNKSQNARQKALTNFKSGKSRFIVATDIAARGIDIAHLELVINYDLPDVAETYVHRIGRTGRAGKLGKAITFCATEELDMLKSIRAITGKQLRVAHVPQGMEATHEAQPKEPTDRRRQGEPRHMRNNKSGQSQPKTRHERTRTDAQKDSKNNNPNRPKYNKTARV